MIAMGQQPGVPFRVGGGGAQRPSRPTRRAQISDNSGSIVKSSLELAVNEDGMSIIHLLY